jgi:tRNA threonylcarbamoyladenosine biosynthesis protein TsaE
MAADHTLLHLTRYLAAESDTLALGGAMAHGLRGGMVIYLSGELGAGKTSLARGILRRLGYAGRIKSPSYPLVEVYAFSSLYLYHFDFYRFKNADEWSDTGFREYFHGGSVCLVEWPERAGGHLPRADIHIRMRLAGEGRDASLDAYSRVGSECLERLT